MLFFENEESCDYIPKKVKNKFKRNSDQMLNYFKKEKGSKDSQAFRICEDINILIEQIKFLSCNLQHYDCIINKWKNYYLSSNLYILNY